MAEKFRSAEQFSKTDSLLSAFALSFREIRANVSDKSIRNRRRRRRRRVQFTIAVFRNSTEVHMCAKEQTRFIWKPFENRFYPVFYWDRITGGKFVYSIPLKPSTGAFWLSNDDPAQTVCSIHFCFRTDRRKSYETHAIRLKLIKKKKNADIIRITRVIVEKSGWYDGLGL